MCGIVGILGKQPIATNLYLSMMHLQHRGQEASGVFSYDPVTQKSLLRTHLGFISELFQTDPVLPSALWGLGHIRYATSGGGGLNEAQPLTLGPISLAHNGNIVNYSAMRKKLEQQKKIFQTNCDSELFPHLLSPTNLLQSVREILHTVEGSYSIIGLLEGVGLFAFRDPFGIRPLLFGRGDKFVAIGSETMALAQIGCTEIQDLCPGTLLFVDQDLELTQYPLLTQKKHAHCSFEFNYFAKAHSILEQQEVYSTRIRLGKLLAKQIRSLSMVFDAVVPIPDTGIPAGIAAAQELNLPLAEGFVRQAQVGRTFIMPGQQNRGRIAANKLVPIHSVFQGKSILLVDDSIVRGTVSKKIVALARQAGAKFIAMASTFPPVRHPCIYGIDFSSQEQLIAHQKTVAEICAELGADALIYNDLESLKEAIGLNDLCIGCVTGDYPTSLKGLKTLQKQRASDLRACEPVT